MLPKQNEVQKICSFFVGPMGQGKAQEGKQMMIA